MISALIFLKKDMEIVVCNMGLKIALATRLITFTRLYSSPCHLAGERFLAEIIRKLPTS